MAHTAPSLPFIVSATLDSFHKQRDIRTIFSEYKTCYLERSQTEQMLSAIKVVNIENYYLARLVK